MVVICGAANLYNDVICYALSRELNLTCDIVESPKALANLSAIVRRDRPNLLLIDASSRRVDTVASDLHRGTQQIQGKLPLAVHNLSRGQKISSDLLRQGVRGLFYLEDNLSHFLTGVRRLLDGEDWFPRDGLPALSFVRTGLTRREAEILAHVSRGESNEGVAERLGLSRCTVKNYLYNIYRKINVNNRFQASLWAAQNMHYLRRESTSVTTG